jgi:ASC-1-like (ASCH) protein
MKTPEIQHQEPRKIFVKKEFFEQILSGQKTAEARPQENFDIVPAAGEKITFECSLGHITVNVTNIQTFGNLQSLVDGSNLSSFGRGINPRNAAYIWKTLYPNYNNEPILVINFEK